MNTQALTISAFFAKDHDEIDAILSRADFREPAAALLILKEFDYRLERHIIWEETVLFPAAARVEPALARGPIPVMLMEHIAIRAAKAKALELLAKGDGLGALARIQEMLVVLAAHNRKEESVLYSACDRLIPKEEAESMLSLLASSAP
ncbi:MAG: hemerythrin domain-containing protein [Elusimicrobiota bacterium]|nr:hemerythrin domain-containing protein [Elusimicrobiota bacterium]